MKKTLSNKKPILITGGSGFLGGLLKHRLLKLGHLCVNIDLVPDTDSHPRLVYIQGDIRSKALLQKVFSKYKFQVVYHCAAVLAHGNYDRSFLWTTNVDGTDNIASLAKQNKVEQVVFISSNCLWGNNMGRMVSEEDKPEPIELYGKSKWEGEKIIMNGATSTNALVLRSPTIIDEGRLGLLSILFEFIEEGRTVWVVGGGNNVYQFIYAQDLIDACVSLIDSPKTGIYNIGSDHVRSLREVYGQVISRAETDSQIKSLSPWLITPMMKIAYSLNLSPLGPYHYKMIGEDFVFNTAKIKKDLAWHPTLTNGEMLWKAYKYYYDNKLQIQNSSSMSDHKKPVNMGAIKLLKWMS